MVVSLVQFVVAKSLRATFRDMDINEDRTVSLSEFAEWFLYQDREYLKGNAREHFSMFDTNRDSRVAWDEYAPVSFGSTMVDMAVALFEGKEDKQFATLDKSIQDSMRKEVRRWRAAGGFSMGLEEFTGFTYPELFHHMTQTLVKETVERYDSNKDGRVSVYELLNLKLDQSQEFADQFTRGEVTVEDTIILGLEDKDQDGFFSSQELGEWTTSNRPLLRKQEAMRIFAALDANGNGRLVLLEMEQGKGHLLDSSVGRLVRDEL